MLCKCECDVIFVGKRNGVTKDGEQYVSIDVLSHDNKKLNFITTKLDIIDFLNNNNIPQFKPIRLGLVFDRQFNIKTRYSNWVCTWEDLKIGRDNNS